MGCFLTKPRGKTGKVFAFFKKNRLVFACEISIIAKTLNMPITYPCLRPQPYPQQRDANQRHKPCLWQQPPTSNHTPCQAENAPLVFSRKNRIFAFEISAIFQRLNMQKQRSISDNNTLRKRIGELPNNSILFRSDFPEYHAEFVGATLSELTEAGVLVKMAQGIYTKPKRSRFGVVLPSVDKVAQAIASRDHAQIIPSGITALNILGLSTQVPMIYTYLTTGSERIIQLAHRQLILKRGVPKNFCYSTRLIALLVQALRALKQDHVGEEEHQIIQQLILKEPNKGALIKDVNKMPAWMKHIVKPMLNEESDGKVVGKK